MKIDILFLDNDLSDHEEYFDNQTIKEYCETHSFEGEKNQILSVPPSYSCLLYTSPSPRDNTGSRMPSSA